MQPDITMQESSCWVNEVKFLLEEQRQIALSKKNAPDAEINASTVQSANELNWEVSEKSNAMPVANTGKKATIDGKAVLLLIFLISFATNLIAPMATTIAMYLKQFSGSSTTYPKIVPCIEVIRCR